jgi:mono/diheme cytochrome c family protein
MRKVLMILVSAMIATLAVPAFAQDAPGRASYDKMCAGCHGPDGKGNEAKAKALKLEPERLNLGRDEVASQTKDDKKKTIVAGKEKMPSYEKKLTAAEQEDVAAYTMTLIQAIRKK